MDAHEQATPEFDVGKLILVSLTINNSRVTPHPEFGSGHLRLCARSCSTTHSDNVSSEVIKEYIDTQEGEQL